MKTRSILLAVLLFAVACSSATVKAPSYPTAPEEKHRKKEIEIAVAAPWQWFEGPEGSLLCFSRGTEADPRIYIVRNPEPASPGAFELGFLMDLKASGYLLDFVETVTIAGVEGRVIGTRKKLSKGGFKVFRDYLFQPPGFDVMYIVTAVGSEDAMTAYADEVEHIIGTLKTLTAVD